MEVLEVEGDAEARDPLRRSLGGFYEVAMAADIARRLSPGAMSVVWDLAGKEVVGGNAADRLAAACFVACLDGEFVGCLEAEKRIEVALATLDTPPSLLDAARALLVGASCEFDTDVCEALAAAVAAVDAGEPESGVKLRAAVQALIDADVARGNPDVGWNVHAFRAACAALAVLDGVW